MTAKGKAIRIRTDAKGWRRIFVQHPSDGFSNARLAVQIDEAGNPLAAGCLFKAEAAKQDYEEIAWQYVTETLDGMCLVEDRLP